MCAFSLPATLSIEDIPLPAVIGEFRVMKDCNAAYCRLYGYRKADILGKSFRILYADDKDFVEKGNIFAAKLARSKVYLDERIMRRRDGSRFWCRVSGRKIEGVASNANVLFCVEPIKRPVTLGRISLSSRQREICSLIAQGQTNARIGIELGLSSRTIETHRFRIMRLATVKNTAELVAWFCNGSKDP